jgi:hypothetical protein
VKDFVLKIELKKHRRRLFAKSIGLDFLDA